MKPTAIFADLAKLLPDAIFAKVTSAKLAKPIFCVRICYFDTHAPEMYLALRITSQARRDQLLAEKGRGALYALWAPGEEGYDAELTVPDEKAPAPGDDAIRKLFAKVYDLIADDEEEHMPEVQRLIQKVARQLNERDWSGRCPVTDDFVVAAADGSMCFAGDADYSDLLNSIPAARLNLLRERGLLGPGEDWDKRPGFEYAGAETSEASSAFAELDVRVRSMPTPERIDYLVDQLTKMAHDEDSDMKRTDTAESWPIDRMQDAGMEGILAALRLASRLMEIEDGLTLGIVYKIVTMVRDAAQSTDEIEILLREILQKSLKLDSGGIPANCAQALHELFGKYPEPKFEYVDGSQVFANSPAYFKVPLGKVTKPWWKFW